MGTNATESHIHTGGTPAGCDRPIKPPAIKPPGTNLRTGWSGDM